MNPVVGVVGVFNLQGASWDRRRRKFCVHDRNPAALSAAVAPADVETFRGGAAAGADRQRQQAAARRQQQRKQQQQHGGGEAVSTSDAADAETAAFACYQFNAGRLRLLPGGDSQVSVTLAASGADTFWFSPVLRCGGVALAPLGLVDMYNGGGAITSISISERRRGGGGGNGADPGSGNGGGGPAVVASVGVRGCGRLLLYSSARPARVWVNMAPRDFEYEPFSGRLEVDVPQSSEGMAAELEVMY